MIFYRDAIIFTNLTFHTTHIQLHISRNSFPEGDIPDEIYNIETLESLAMSYNGFGGTISSDISTLKNLKEFWSSYNDITGSIPEGMGDLSQLESLV